MIHERGGIGALLLVVGGVVLIVNGFAYLDVVSLSRSDQLTLSVAGIALLGLAAYFLTRG